MPTTMLDLLARLGAWSLPMLWAPLAFWTAGALLALAALRLAGRRLPPLAHYRARQALLFALPLGLLAAAATDFSFLAAWLAPAVATPSEGSVQILPLLAAPEAAAAPLAPRLTLTHALGLATGLAGGLALWRLGRLLADAGALARFRRALDVQLPDGLARHLIEAAGLRRRVEIAWTAQPVAPMTFGAARPVIVLPEALRGTPEKLRLALAHELVHVRRGDALMQGIEQFVAALFAVHPLAAVLRRAVAARREQATDAAVLGASAADARRYADLLYRFAQPAAPRSVRALAMAAHSNDLKSRIEAMKDHPATNRRFPRPQRLSLALGALLLALAVGLAACADLAGPVKPDDAQTNTEKAAIEARRVQIAEGGTVQLNGNTLTPADLEAALRQGNRAAAVVVDVASNAPRSVVNDVQQHIRAAGVQKINYHSSSSAPQSEGDEAFADAPMTVDDMPELKGGLDALAKNVHYPELARKAGVEGRVIVQFIVDEQGHVTEPKVIASPHEALSEEALRVVKAATFTPGRQDGEAAKVRMSIPINFALPSGEDTGSSASEEASPSSEAIESVEVDKRGERPTIRVQTKPGTSEAMKAQIRQEAERAQPDAQVTVE